MKRLLSGALAALVVLSSIAWPQPAKTVHAEKPHASNAEQQTMHKTGYIQTKWDNHAPAVGKKVSLKKVVGMLENGHTKTDSVKLNSLPGSIPIPSGSIEMPQAYPAAWDDKYGLGNFTNTIPQIRNQNPYEACWAFAAIGLAEMYQVRNGSVDNTVDYSERHLVYNTYTDGTTPALSEAHQQNWDHYCNNMTEKQKLQEGGFFVSAAQTLLNQRGIAAETTAEYPNAKLEPQIQNWKDIEHADVAKLTDCYHINIKQNPEIAKYWIKQHGAVGIDFCAQDAKNGTNETFFNGEFSSFYNDTGAHSNHAVIVVGWDDNFPKENFGDVKPNQDGAWLVRNSWGEQDFSFSGYFWMSYDETTLQDTCYAFVVEDAKNLPDAENLYTYTTGYSSPNKNSKEAANVFEANNNEILRSVSFMGSWDTNPSNGYNRGTIQVCDVNEDGTPGDVRRTFSVDLPVEGTYTFDLEQPLELEAGEKYAVSVKLRTGGISQEDDYEFDDGQGGTYYESTVGSNKGESYYKDGDNWIEVDNEDGNFFINALTTDATSKTEIGASQVSVLDNDAVYTGNPVKPEVTVSGLTKGTDYTVSYYNNIDAGKATAVVRGIGRYKGTVSKEFTIKKAALSDNTDEDYVLSRPDDIDAYANLYEYNGEEIRPGIIVYCGDYRLTEGVDYTVEYENNNAVGEANVVVTGNGNYTGTHKVPFTIEEKVADSDKTEITENDVALEFSEATYNGGWIEPEVIVTINDATLESSADYTVEYTDNINAGTATVTVTGIRGYKGEVTKNFTITPLALTDEIIDIDPEEYSYTGEEIAPVVWVITGYNDDDEPVWHRMAEGEYSISFEGDATNVSDADVTATVTGQGNFAGTATDTFKIIKMNLEDYASVDGIENQTYTGSGITLDDLQVKIGDSILTKEQDYTVTYDNNTEIGTATVTITGTGNYTGSITEEFLIESVSVEEGYITVGDIADQTYTGDEMKPEVVVEDTRDGVNKTLEEGTDYELEYEDNVDVGTATVWVHGLGAYSGWTDATFEITEAPITEATVTMAKTSVTYTGAEQKPAVTKVVWNGKELEEGTDYTVTSYVNNTNVGDATVSITGKGNFNATCTGTFAITAASLTDATVTLDTTGYEFDGSAKTPTPTVKLGDNTLPETDYEVSYENNTNKGTAKAIITAKSSNVTGEKEATFTIGSKSIEDAEVTLEDETWTYDGNEKKPEVSSVKVGENTLTKDVDYTVSYGNNIEVGQGTVVIAGKGNYGGEVTKTFTIGKGTASIAFAKDKENRTYGDAAFVEGLTNTGDGEVSYSSSDPQVATVAPNGKVTIKGVGETAITATVADGNKYQYENKSVTFTLEVAKKEVTITGLTVATKTYDKTTEATPVGTALISGKVGNDTVTVKAGTATFDNEKVGDNHTVTFSGYSLEGADAEKYVLKAQPAEVTAAIAVKPVTVTVTAKSRAYIAGNKSVAILSGAVEGVLEGDEVTADVSHASGSMQDADAGENKDVSVLGVTMAGTDAGNYTLTAQPTGTKVTITKAEKDAVSVEANAKYATSGKVELKGYLEEGGKPGTVSIKADADSILDGTPTVSGTGISYRLCADENGNTVGKNATIEVTVTDAKNYKPYSVLVKITVSDKLPQKDFGFKKGTVEKTYGDKVFTEAVEGAVNGSKVTYTSGDTTVATVNDAGAVTIKKAGTVQITAKASATDDYESAIAVYNLVVEKATITVTAKSIQQKVNAEIPSLANPKKGEHYTVEGLFDNDAVEGAIVMSYQKDGETITPDKTKAGEYDIAISGLTVKDETNYEKEIRFVSGKLTIELENSTPSAGGGSAGGGGGAGGGSTPSEQQTTQPQETITHNQDGSTTVITTQTNVVENTTTTTTTEITTNAEGEVVAKKEESVVEDEYGNVIQKTVVTTETGKKGEVIETTAVTDEKGAVTTDTLTVRTSGARTYEHTETTAKGASTSNMVKVSATGVVKSIVVEIKNNKGKVTEKDTYKPVSGEKVALVSVDVVKKALEIPAKIKAADGKTYKVTEIAKEAFAGNKKLKNITIVGALKSVGHHAFYGIAKNAVIVITNVTKKEFEATKKKLVASGLPSSVKIVRKK